jgi:hypothetical protein
VAQIAEIAKELDRIEAELDVHPPLRTREDHRREVELLDRLVLELNQVDHDLHLLRRARDGDADTIECEQDFADRIRMRVLHRRSRLQGAALGRIESAGAIITVAFLLPTLVAAVYGAEAAIPGRGPTEDAAAYIVLGSVLVGFALGVMLWFVSRGPRRGEVLDDDGE